MHHWQRSSPKEDRDSIMYYVHEIQRSTDCKHNYAIVIRVAKFKIELEPDAFGYAIRNDEYRVKSVWKR